MRKDPVAARQPLSVVVPTRDRPEHLASCLAALAADLRPQDQVVVVDSASTVPVRDAVLCDRPGASLARNTGWRTAAHDLVAFVDDDVLVLPGWADALVAAFDDPSVGFVAGRVGVPVGQEDRVRPVAVTTLQVATRLTAETPGTLGATANLGVRRTVLASVGGFDERLGPGTSARAAEDVDLMDRLFEAGVEGVFAPAAAAVHDQWRTRPQLLALESSYGVGLGWRLVLLARRGRRRRAVEIARQDLLHGTVTTAFGDLRHGFQLGVLLAGSRLLGVAAGLVRAGAATR